MRYQNRSAFLNRSMHHLNLFKDYHHWNTHFHRDSWWEIHYSFKIYSYLISSLTNKTNVPLGAVHEHKKKLNGFYNGLGWFIENKHRKAVSEACENASVRFMEFPISEGFGTLRRQHNTVLLTTQENHSSTG